MASISLWSLNGCSGNLRAAIWNCQDARVKACVEVNAEVLVISTSDFRFGRPR